MLTFVLTFLLALFFAWMVIGLSTAIFTMRAAQKELKKAMEEFDNE